MRTAFVNTLIQLAKKNKDIILLTADLGYSVFEEYMEKFPKQYLNVGIAEQNMTGVAAGMAIEGKLPIIYSIIPFTTMRNFEQIRNDVCYQNLNVKIVGVGAGFSYGPYGHTHHALEDIGILRTLPNIRIYSPADALEAKYSTEWLISQTGPAYLRLGRTGEPDIYNPGTFLTEGKGITVKKGLDAVIIATGSMVYVAKQVVQLLKQENISAQLISMPTIKPLDQDLILALAKKFPYLFTLEEHFLTGGLGSAVAEVLAENNINVSFKRFAVPNAFLKQMGNQEYMRRISGLTPDILSKEITFYIAAKKL